MNLLSLSMHMVQKRSLKVDFCNCNLSKVLNDHVKMSSISFHFLAIQFKYLLFCFINSKSIDSSFHLEWLNGYLGSVTPSLTSREPVVSIHDEPNLVSQLILFKRGSLMRPNWKYESFYVDCLTCSENAFFLLIRWNCFEFLKKFCFREMPFVWKGKGKETCWMSFHVSLFMILIREHCWTYTCV